MVREPQGTHRRLCSCAPGEREIKFKFSWLSVRFFSFFLYFSSLRSLLWFYTSIPSQCLGLLRPRYFRLLLIHTFLRKNGNFFFLFSVDNKQPEKPPVLWLTMDTANRCQRRKPTVFLHSWLHSKAVQRRQSHGSWDPYENTYSTNFAHISQDACKQAEQDCTIRRNRNLAANVTL